MTSASSPNPPEIGAVPTAAQMIERSRAQRLRVSAWPLLLVGVVALMLWTQPADGAGLAAARALAVLVLVGGYIALIVAGRRIAARLAAEGAAVSALEELVQLRRWPEAAQLAERLLDQPMLSPDRRAAALVSAASILARYHRFSEAREVHEHLLQSEPGEPQIEPTLGHSLRVARAMTLLREDLLVDADRAMGEIRREVAIARDAVRRERGPEAAEEIRSAGLTLLDLYRDVKTGHADEAIAGFEKAIGRLPESLGVRVADAWVLAAAAYDRLGRSIDATRAYENATTLVPAVELHRRYPETVLLADRYNAATWPT